MCQPVVKFVPPKDATGCMILSFLCSLIFHRVITDPNPIQEDNRTRLNIHFNATFVWSLPACLPMESTPPSYTTIIVGIDLSHSKNVSPPPLHFVLCELLMSVMCIIVLPWDKHLDPRTCGPHREWHDMLSCCGGQITLSCQFCM